MTALNHFIAVENVVQTLKSKIEGTWELTPDRLNGNKDHVAVSLTYTNKDVTRNFTVMAGKIHAPNETTEFFADILCQYTYGVDACAVFELNNTGEVILDEWFADTIGNVQDYVENDYIAAV